MTTFIQDVLLDLSRQGKDLSELVFVLPNKRSGIVLKNEIGSVSLKVQFTPKILAIEELVQEISELRLVSPTTLLIETYRAYCASSFQESPESFDQFLNWGPRLIQDFVEIDRYLIDVDSLFKSIQQLKSIEAFGQDQKTPLVSNYLKFWEQLMPIYHQLNKTLLESGQGHQGLMYRNALENLENYLNEHQSKEFVFLGFNALNASEEIIFQELLSREMGTIYWDNDHYFLNNEMEEAGLFMRNYFNSWNYYKREIPLGLRNHFTAPKKFKSIETPKSVGQAKYVGGLLKSLWEKNKCENTAVVLADETLLLPLLTALPEDIDVVNITMGFPLKATPVAGLLSSIFNLHINGGSEGFYYKYVLSILSNPLIESLVGQPNRFWIKDLTGYIQEQNLMFITTDQLRAKANDNLEWIDLIFSYWEKPEQALDRLVLLIELIKNSITRKTHSDFFTLECLYKYFTLLNSLKLELKDFNGVQSIKTLEHLYESLMEEASLDFKGEPLKGLQIMGILESRVLDFETVIITSVNEGVLPAGKQQHSFIPYDVKRAFDLPTIKEKDAIYAYHFYHLTQRASDVFLIYDSAVDRLQGGEPSRYLLQLAVGKVHQIAHLKAIAQTPTQKEPGLVIQKTPEIAKALEELGSYGYSPSALTLYINDPFKFYQRYILGLEESDEVEESMAARTFGNAIHNTLEALYKPFQNNYLSEETITGMTSQVPLLAERFFRDQMKGADIKTGKNLLAFEIGKHYILQSIQEDLKLIQQGGSLKIISVEEKFEALMPLSGLPFQVKIRGKIDRVDQLNGITRIIDYKTGSQITASSLKIKDWSSLTNDYHKYHKCFQILCYAYLWRANHPNTSSVEGGVFALKNISLGLIRLGIPSEDGKTYSHSIDRAVLDQFEQILSELVLTIHNPKIPFATSEK